MGSLGREDTVWQEQGGSGSGWWNGWSHIHVWWTKLGGIPWERAIPAPGQTVQPRVLALGK